MIWANEYGVLYERSITLSIDILGGGLCKGINNQRPRK